MVGGEGESMTCTRFNFFTEWENANAHTTLFYICCSCIHFFLLHVPMFACLVLFYREHKIIVIFYNPTNLLQF